MRASGCIVVRLRNCTQVDGISRVVVQAQGSGFRVSALGFRGLGGLAFRFSGFGCWVLRPAHEPDKWIFAQHTSPKCIWFEV